MKFTPSVFSAPPNARFICRNRLRGVEPRKPGWRRRSAFAVSRQLSIFNSPPYFFEFVESGRFWSPARTLVTTAPKIAPRTTQTKLNTQASSRRSKFSDEESGWLAATTRLAAKATPSPAPNPAAIPIPTPSRDRRFRHNAPIKRPANKPTMPKPKTTSITRNGPDISPAPARPNERPALAIAITRLPAPTPRKAPRTDPMNDRSTHHIRSVLVLLHSCFSGRFRVDLFQGRTDPTAL